jgi:hypothetical protein
MDVEDETARFKVMMVVGIVFLISAFLSWRELKYTMIGKQADAKLVRVYTFQDVGRRGRVREKIAVEYEFKDAKTGGVRSESDTLPITAKPPKGPTVKVQYLEGSEGGSRLAGNTQKIWLWICGGTLAFLAYKFFALVRESKA